MKRGLNNSNVYTMNAQAGETVPLAVTPSPVSVNFANLASAINTDIIISNIGPSVAFVGFGTNSVTATLPGTTGTINAYPILPGSIHTLQKNVGTTQYNTCGACCQHGETTTLYFTAIQGS